MKQRGSTLESVSKSTDGIANQELTAEAAEFHAEVAEKKLLFLRSSAKTSASSAVKNQPDN